MKHEIKVTQEQSNCCDDPSHWHYLASCSCGWTATATPSSLYGQPEDINDDIKAHKIEVLLEASGVEFTVDKER